MPKYILTAGALLVVMLGLSAPVYAASVLRVPQDFPTIQAAIDAALDGDIVRVSPGTYVERINFKGKNITVESSDGPSGTVIDGNRGGTVVTLIADPGETPVLRGFTITRGGGVFFDGGGIRTSGGSPVIERNVITDNEYCGAGGGIEAAFSSAVIRENVISNNRQQGCSGGTGGGGIAVRGAGSVQILANEVTGNSHGFWGGGISLFAAGNPVINRNVIRNNFAGSEGGGIASVNLSNPLVTNNVIAGNYAATGAGISWSSGGGGVSIVNNTIVSNTAGRYAIFASGLTGESRLVNNLLVSTNAEPALFCGFLDTSNPPSIAFNDVFNTTSGPRYGGACIEQTGANGNIAADPLLIDPAAGDFHLGPGSPAIDAGTNAGTPSDDIDGDSRPIDGNGDRIAIADMGADELRPSDTTSPVITVPAEITVNANATSPAGANVTFTVTATDEDPANPTVTCTPPSGSLFAIGNTLVECTATDASGNRASARFTVHVKGAPEQVADLIALVDSYNLRQLGAALHDKLVKVQAFLAANKPKRACERLDSFLGQVKEQKGKRLPVDQADRLATDARRIKAVIGC